MPNPNDQPKPAYPSEPPATHQTPSGGSVFGQAVTTMLGTTVNGQPVTGQVNGKPQ